MSDPENMVPPNSGEPPRNPARRAMDPDEGPAPDYDVEARHAGEPTSSWRDPVAMASDKPRLFSSAMNMASGSLVSRILGLVRVLLVGYILGTVTSQADMFSAASEIPSTIYLLLLGGVLNAVI
ncbi:MAG: hypothetical protein FWF25_06070, partial [Propionibacteriaceae bacterium]|nr:hypothetical protein [Propionibacteriaceae bacterium]